MDRPLDTHCLVTRLIYRMPSCPLAGAGVLEAAVGARVVLRVLAGVGALAAAALPASTETMDGALRRAYVANPTLNAQRAQVRITDETVPIAKSGQRPRITGTADIGFSEIGSHSDSGPGNHTSLKPGGVGVVLNQNVFDGLRTRNSTRAAESQVFGARETLRNSEQNVLLNGATDYMNVLRDSAILSLQRNNVEVLQEQLRQTKERFGLGEVTRTDVAQAEAALAGGQSQVSLAESNLKTSIAAYRRDIGDEPKQLAPGRSIEKFLPRTIDLAVATSQAEHPAINASMHGVDSAELQVKVAEGALYPSVGAVASLTKRYDVQIPGDIRNTASVTALLTVPIYEGGEFYARTRQAKETAGQARINVDVTRDQVRAAVVSAWGALEAAKAQIIATQAQVNARSPSTACARRRRSASAPPSTCSTRSRRCSTRVCC